MNCHSLSEPIHCLIRDVPHTTVGTPENAPPFLCQMPPFRERRHVHPLSLSAALCRVAVCCGRLMEVVLQDSREGFFVDRFHEGCMGL